MDIIWTLSIPYIEANNQAPGFYASDMDGNMYKGTDWEWEEGWIAMERPLFKAAVEMLGAISLSDVYIDSVTNVPVITISKAIYKGSKINGVVAIDLFLDELAGIVTESVSGTDNFSFLVTDAGKFVIDTKHDIGSPITEVENGSLKDFSVKMYRTSTDTIFSHSINGQTYYFKTADVHLVGSVSWYYCYGMPKSEVFKGAFKISNILIITFSQMFVLLVILITFTVMNISKPLRLSVDGITKMVANGNADFSQRLNIKSYGEVRTLVDTFNIFIEDLQKIIGGLKNTENMLKSESELMQTATRETSDSISDIINSIVGVHRQIENQASSIDTASNVVGNVSHNIGTLTSLIDTQSVSISEASSAIEQMLGSIGSVNTTVQAMADSFSMLEKNVSQSAEKQAAMHEHIIEGSRPLSFNNFFQQLRQVVISVIVPPLALLQV